MKQTNSKKKQIVTEDKPRFTRIGFWFPILYGTINIFLFVFSLMIYSAGDTVSNPEFAKIILGAFEILLMLSPSAFILLLFLHRRHSARFRKCSDLFRHAPGIFGMFSVLVEILYLIVLVL